MKKTKLVLLLAICTLFVLFAVASGDDTSTTVDQGTDNNAIITTEDDTAIGDYSVEISDCRFAKDYEGNDVIIIKYIFSNISSEEPTAFWIAFDCLASQNGIGLNEAYVLEESANYDESNQNKEIKKGASLEVEVAYELNDTTTPVEIEVEELFSFDDKTLTKTFEIAE